MNSETELENCSTAAQTKKAELVAANHAAARVHLESLSAFSLFMSTEATVQRIKNVINIE